MYDPPAYVWAITIAGPTAIAATTCIAPYGGAKRAGLGRRRAALLAGAAAVLLGGWFTASAAIAGHGWYDTRTVQVPWLPIAAAGSLAALLALSRIPVVARAVTAPGMASRLVLPHSFRVAGVFWPPARSCPAPRRALLWRQARHPAPGESPLTPQVVRPERR